jgi:hypothetical protein
MRPYLSSSHSWFIHQSSLAITKIHLVANQKKTWREMAVECCLRSISFTLVGLFSMYDVGPTALLPLRRQLCCVFLSPLKVRRSRLALNPRTFGTMASTLRTRPPRRLIATPTLVMELSEALSYASNGITGSQDTVDWHTGRGFI